MSTTKPWLEFYDEGVPAEVDIPEIPLHQVMVQSSIEQPDTYAARLILRYLPLGICIQSKLTYSELDAVSNRFAAALQQLGMRKGDRVAIMLPNIVQYVVSFYGTLKAGCIVVNTNPTYTPRELRHQLADSGAKAIVLMSGLVSRVQEIIEETDIEHIIVADIHEVLAWPFRSLVEKQLRANGTVVDLPSGVEALHFSDLLKQNPKYPQPVDVRKDDIALFQYTGGTTGSPKAAMLSHGNVVSNAYQMQAWFADNLIRGHETILGALPFFHVYGMTVGMLLAHASASQLVMTPDPRDVELVMRIIHQEKVSIYPGVPAMYNAINNHPDVDKYDLKSVKACLSGGSSLPVEVATRFEEITGGRLVEGYGLSETSPVTAANPLFGYRKIGSIGAPISSTRMAIVSLTPEDDGSYMELAPGEEGEIVVYGPQVMTGYWNHDDETAQTIDSSGALHTGDLGKMDEEGFFYVVDRKKDLIIASGYNIVPREVEEVLFMHPKVMEAAVAGIPDEKRGETVKAFIVLHENESSTRDEIRAFCKQYLAPYKVPTAVEFRSDLPKSQVGKVLKRTLIEQEISNTAGSSANV